MIIKDLLEIHNLPLVYEAALKNCNEGCDENDLLGSAFLWSKSKEGLGFWENICDKYFKEAKKIQPHLFEIDSWCVQITEKNREDVIKYFKKRYTTLHFAFSLNRYYGITEKGVFKSRINSQEFSKVLTTEEFYQKIGKTINNQTINKQIENGDSNNESLQIPRRIAKITAGERPNGCTVLGRTKRVRIEGSHLPHETISVV